MNKQHPHERVKNFNEVALGLTEEEAVAEAARCLQCKKPFCVTGCPVEIDIPRFLLAVKERRFYDAAAILRERNSLPAITGRVCPQEDQCEKECVLAKKGRAIDIGGIERFVADWEARQTKISTGGSGAKSPAAKGLKVAVIGSGPAGLTCAADLAKMGYAVTIFESLHKAGGVLEYGIPNFRLPKEIIAREVGYIKSLGVQVEVNILVGKTISLGQLRSQGFKAFFVATGAGLPHFLGIPGENLNGVYSANEFLTRVNLMKAYLFPKYDTPVKTGKNILVIGGGNVAMDAARSAKRLGAEHVKIVYRRTESEMPARRDEIENAKEEGVEFEFLAAPVRIVGTEEGWVKELVCLRNKLGDPDSGGRRKPVPVPGSEFGIPADTVICAVGQDPNPIFVRSVKNLELHREGTIKADPQTGKTSIEDVFAGGDIVTGAATVILAMGAGKRAARAIDEYLKKSGA